MSDEFQATKYLRKQTGETVTIKEVKHDQVKNQVVVVFEGNDGALIDGKFDLQGEYSAYAQKSMNKIKTLLGIESLKNDGPGKQIGVHLDMKDFTYKKGPKAGSKGTSCNIVGYFLPKSGENVSQDLGDLEF